LYSPWKTTMTSGQDVSEYLDTLGLVKSYFFKFCEEKKIEKKSKKKCRGAQTPQRMRQFPCLQDCLLTLTCHLAWCRRGDVQRGRSVKTQETQVNNR
jgi:hypothetical protein